MNLLHEFFENATDRFPDRVAVQSGKAVFTYRTLDESANRLAHLLRQHVAAPENCVGILLPRDEQLYCAMLAILKAGAAYLPLDPETPPERIHYILGDARVKCLVTTSELASKAGDAAPLLCVDRKRSVLAAQPATRIFPAETGVAPQNICYVIYTSGTTGRPKGVMVEHRNVTSLVLAESALYGIRAEDRVFQFASPAFDASVEEIWMAFSHGAALIAGTPDIIRSGPDFSMHMERLGITVLSCVPTFLSMLDRDIPTLRLLILGGEECPPSLPARWHKPGRKIFNTYGPTEATVIATAALLEPGRPVTIGRAVAGYRTFILDGSGQPVPRGEAGELCIGGSGVTRGYLGETALTEKKFTTLTGPDGNPVRIYHSGDKARCLPSGDIEFLGRLDDQVKVRGYRIERGEIEAILCEIPAVQAAAVDVQRSTDQLAAWVVVRPGQVLDRAVVRRLLEARLPAYMVPSFLDEVDALPLTTSGKIDRARLPSPCMTMGESSRSYVAPRTETEGLLLTVWQKVLKRPNVSVTDDFFLDLDGHSLLAAMTVSELRRHAPFSHLSVGDIYTAPTIEKLAQRLDGAGDDDQKKQKSVKTEKFQPISRLSYLLCSIGQACGILFLCGVNIVQWLGPFLAYGYLAVADLPILSCLIASVIVLVVTTPLTLIFSILKMGPVSIASQASVGSMSTVLYDCKMDEGIILDDLSLMMKGETLPANTHWQGIPAQPVRKMENP